MKTIILGLILPATCVFSFGKINSMLLQDKSPQVAYSYCLNSNISLQPSEPAAIFSDFLDRKWEGHYVDSPDTEHFLHSIRWNTSINGNLVIETKEVVELNFFMTTIYFRNKNDEYIRFIRNSNKGGTSEGIVKVIDNIIHLEAINELGQVIFKYSYTLLPDGSICDKFFRMNPGGTWRLGHKIVYQSEKIQSDR